MEVMRATRLTVCSEQYSLLSRLLVVMGLDGVRLAGPDCISIATVGRLGPTARRPLSTQSADLSHVCTVRAHPFATFSASCSGFVACKLMSGPLCVSRLAPFTGNFLLFFHIH